MIRTAREDGGEVEHLGELGVCEDVFLELDGAEVPGKLEQTLGLLVVDDEQDRVILVDALVLEPCVYSIAVSYPPPRIQERVHVLLIVKTEKDK